MVIIWSWAVTLGTFWRSFWPNDRFPETKLCRFPRMMVNDTEAIWGDRGNPCRPHRGKPAFLAKWFLTLSAKIADLWLDWWALVELLLLLLFFLIQASLGWLMGKSTGKHGFNHQYPPIIGVFNVDFPKKKTHFWEGLGWWVLGAAWSQPVAKRWYLPKVLQVIPWQLV